MFLDRDNFPESGNENILYIDNDKIYKWVKENSNYIEISASIWEPIS